MKTAVIGAGISGAACAGLLRESGHEVTVYERSGGLGGRMATRRFSWHGPDKANHEVAIDHGAQYFTARTPAFRAVVEAGLEQGWIARWDFTVENGSGAAADRYVGLPGMPALAKAVLGDAPVVCDTNITSLSRSGRDWVLHTEQTTIDEGYSRVVLAMTPPQAARLLASHLPDWHRALLDIRMVPCWTLLAITDATDWPYDAARVRDPANPLTWIARNEYKPGRRKPGSNYPYTWWTAQAKGDWTFANLSTDRDNIRQMLESGIASAIGRPRETMVFRHSVVHRWLYAVSHGNPPAGAERAWWHPQARIGVCGDGIGGIGVERAFASGLALAEQMTAGFPV